MPLPTTSLLQKSVRKRDGICTSSLFVKNVLPRLKTFKDRTNHQLSRCLRLEYSCSVPSTFPIRWSSVFDNFQLEIRLQNVWIARRFFVGYVVLALYSWRSFAFKWLFIRHYYLSVPESFVYIHLVEKFQHAITFSTVVYWVHLTERIIPALLVRIFCLVRTSFPSLHTTKVREGKARSRVFGTFYRLPEHSYDLFHVFSH